MICALILLYPWISTCHNTDINEYLDKTKGRKTFILTTHKKLGKRDSDRFGPILDLALASDAKLVKWIDDFDEIKKIESGLVVIDECDSLLRKRTKEFQDWVVSIKQKKDVRLVMLSGCPW